MSEQTKTSQILTIRGQLYTRHEYDWYIDEAIHLAPTGWSFEQIMSLRDAIRENYNHGHNLHTWHLERNEEGLRHFIRMIIDRDPAANISYPEWLEENDERGTMNDERKSVSDSSFIIHHSSLDEEQPE